jgi:hypothetical protein
VNTTTVGSTIVATGNGSNLTGTPGAADVFDVSNAGRNVHIRGFESGSDTLDFGSGVSFADLQITDRGNGIRISDGDTRVTLRGVHEFTAADLAGGTPPAALTPAADTTGSAANDVSISGSIVANSGDQGTADVTFTGEQTSGSDPVGAVANCVGNADDASGLVKVVGSGSVVNRCLLCQCLAEALPSIDFAHGDLP